MSDQPLPRPMLGGKYAWRIPVARQPVVEIKCSRCPKVEYKPFVEGEEAPTMPLLSVMFEGEIFKFDDLCSKCRKTIKSYLVNMFKDLKQSRKHGAKKKAEQPSPK